MVNIERGKINETINKLIQIDEIIMIKSIKLN